MEELEAFEKGKLIKDALKIVDELANNDLADIDYPFDCDDFDYMKLQELIDKAKRLKKNRLWLLK